MDPFLEHPDVFPDFHDRLTTHLSEAIQARLPEPYYAALGRRIWVEMSHRYIEPDVDVLRPRRETPARGNEGAVAVAEPALVARPVLVHVPHDEHREPFIEIYAKGDQGKRLVTSIEVLSLANKTNGAHGRGLYLKKQAEILEGLAHLVEIDLLRADEHSTAVPRDWAVAAAGPFDYHISVHRFDNLEDFFVYPIRLEQRLPPVEIPLLPGDGGVTIDLQAVFDRCYDAGPYRREIDYWRDAIVPPLANEQAEWAARLVGREAG